MGESRQVRRARQRRDAKATGRPGPNVVPEAAASPGSQPAPAVLEVDLRRYVFDDEHGRDVSWSAEWSLQGHDVGIEGSADDLPELIDLILSDAQDRWGDTHALGQIMWHVDGDRLDGQSVDAAIAAAGITLPDHFPAHE